MSIKANQKLKPARPRRVLLVSPISPPVGGIATWTEILLREIKNYPQVEIKHLNTALRWKKQKTHSLWSRLFGGVLQAVSDLFFVFIAFISFRPDVLHVTTSAAFASFKDSIFMLLSRCCHTTSFLHYHTSDLITYQPGTWQFRASQFAMQLATRVIVLDPKTHTLLLSQLPPQKVAKIPNMIDLEHIDRIKEQASILPTSTDQFDARCVFVGRAVPDKGLRELVDVCVTIDRLQLHLVGPISPNFQHQLQVMSTKRDGGSWLVFHGPVSHEEACQKIQQNDIVVLPSYFEAFPYVVLEAMSLEKPVLVSNAGAMAEMIEADSNRACGVCVEARDLVSLQEGLTHLLVNSDHWKTIGQRGRKRVESCYTIHAVLSQLVEQWLTGSSPAPPTKTVNIPTPQRETQLAK